ncbi:hypothetical protein OQA88_461 [Cercophora sp. LCS_1]
MPAVAAPQAPVIHYTGGAGYYQHVQPTRYVPRYDPPAWPAGWGQAPPSQPAQPAAVAQQVYAQVYAPNNSQILQSVQYVVEAAAGASTYVNSSANGMAIPVAQAPCASIPVVIQQPAHQPPAQMVIVQAPPVAAAGPHPPPPPPAIPVSAPALGPGPAAPQIYVMPGNGSRPVQSWAYGATASEVQARNAELARTSGANDPQEFKPADPNPNRLYWCRERDNTYLLRDRRTLDQQKCIWYMTPAGQWYAVQRA